MFLKAITAIVVSLVLAIMVSLTFNYFHIVSAPNWWFSPVALSVLFIIANIVVHFQYNNDPEKSTELILGIIAVKLLTLMIGIFIYSLYDKKGLFHFSMHFITHYILFTIFEIRYLLHVIKSR